MQCHSANGRYGPGEVAHVAASTHRTASNAAWRKRDRSLGTGIATMQPANQPCLNRTDLINVISGISRGPAITSKACPAVMLPGTSTAR